MDTEERTHIESLLQIHWAYLRDLELKAAKYGELNVPTHITMQIGEYRQKIAELAGHLSKLLPRHNLPPRDYEQFVGRQQELAEVRRLLSPRSRAVVVTVDGIGGIGKSALALESAYAFHDQYAQLPAIERFEAIVWISAKRSYLTAGGILERHQAFRTLDDLYAAIAQVLDYPAITRVKAEEQRAIVEGVLREHRTLLILDNLETVDNEQLLSFLRELPDPTKAIVTTRHRIDIAYPVRLAGMPHEDALKLITQEAERKRVSLSTTHQESLWQRTGGVPLAIVWSIGLMNLGGSVESVLHRLESGQSDIARFCFEEGVAEIRSKHKEAHRLLLTLSLFSVDASREALGIIAGFGEDTFGRDLGLEQLQRLSLVNKEEDRFSLLPLTHSFVLSESTRFGKWLNRARARWQVYFHTLVEDNGGWSDNWRGHDLIERELENIIAVIEYFVNHLKYHRSGDDSITIDISSLESAKMIVSFISDVTRTCRLRGYWNECENLHRTAIRIGRAINDTGSIGWSCYDLSRISYYRGDKDAEKRWALEVHLEWMRGDHKEWMCHADRLLGLVALHNGEFEEATQLLNKALNDYRRLKADGSPEDFVESLGYLAEQQSDYPRARSLYQQAVDLCRQRNNSLDLAANLLNLGRVELAILDVVAAKDAFEESLKLARESGRIEVIAQGLYHIASLETMQSNHRSGIDNVHQALDLFRRLGMKREQADAEALLAKLSEESQTD
jgi:tetratricopeptide (TPR) repeat protein